MAFTHYKTPSFVFRKKDKSEADRIFTAFSFDYGKIQVCGKSIRKITSKLRSGIGLFYLSEIEFIQGRKYKTLTDAKVLKRYEGIERNLKKLSVAFKISQVLNNFLKFEEKDEKIWNLITETFEKLNNTEKIRKADCQILYYYFLWNFFDILGYHPDLHNCVLCQNKIIPENICFSNKEGGLVCRKCKKEEKDVSSELVKILRFILQKNLKDLFQLKISLRNRKELMELSREYYFYLLPLFSHSDNIN